MYAYDFEAKVNAEVNNNVNNNQKTITTGNVTVIAGPGSSTCGINC